MYDKRGVLDAKELCKPGIWLCMRCSPGPNNEKRPIMIEAFFGADIRCRQKY